MLSTTRPPSGRTVASVEAALRGLLTEGGLDLPLPGGGATPRRWTRLADWGRRDLTLARLAEGHLDAVAILAEAGRVAHDGALYGVWAARSGAGARLVRDVDVLCVDGTVRFCSGAHVVDRALVVAGGPEPSLVEIAVAPPGARPDPGTWRTAAMDAADTLDVRFDRVPVEGVLGPPGWYTARPGFTLGGGGVAAVWWGGAAGLLERALGSLPAAPDAHQLAHLGELHAALAAAEALLARAAGAVDDAPDADHTVRMAQARCAVETVVRAVLDRVPRMLGPGPLSRDGELARTLADLGIYVRQHHGERDHAALGALVLAEEPGR